MTQPSQDEASLPFYKTVKRKFQDVDLEGGVNTAQFCEAVDAVIAFFDLFTNAPFAIIRSDLASKVAKVRERLASQPSSSGTLEALLKDEKDKGVVGKPEAVTGALTWLMRSLRFTGMGLRKNMANASEEVSTSMTWAYGQALKPYHGWAVRPIFLVSPPSPRSTADSSISTPPSPYLRVHSLRQLAMKAVPYRSNFYAVLGEPADDVMRELELWLDGLDKILTRMEAVYKEGRYGSMDGKP